MKLEKTIHTSFKYKFIKYLTKNYQLIFSMFTIIKIASLIDIFFFFFVFGQAGKVVQEKAQVAVDYVKDAVTPKK